MAYAKQFQGTMGAIIMARVSGDGQTDNTSLEGQIDAGHIKAAQLGIPILYTIKEGLSADGKQRGKSAAYLCDRAEMQEAIGLIQQGKASHLICLDTSRYSRDMEDTFAIRRMVEGAGGTLVFTDFDYKAGDEGSELELTFRAGFNVYERHQIKKRTMRGRNKVLTGQKIQPSRARSPYGYLIVNKLHVLAGLYPADMLGKYIIDEEKAEWVRQAYIRYAGGMGLRGVCQWLTDAGAPPPGSEHKEGSRQWYAPSLRQILIRPVYKGAVACNRYQPVTDRSRVERGLKIRTHVERPEEDWIMLEAPAIVDASLWEVCQQRLMTAKEEHSGNPKYRYLLSGLISCPYCGLALVGDSVTRRPKYGEEHTDRYYLCQQKRRTRGLVSEEEAQELPPCAHKQTSYPGGVLEALIIDNLIKISEDPTLIETAINSQRRQRASGFDQGRYDALLAEVAALDRQEQKMIELQLEAAMEDRDTTAYKVMLTKIKAKRTENGEALASMEAERKMTPSQPARTQAEEMSKAAAGVRRALEHDELDAGRKRAALAAVISDIVPVKTDGGYQVSVAFKPIERGGTVTIIKLMITDEGLNIHCREKEHARN